MLLKWRSVPAGHCDPTYETVCLISVASIGARGCVIDCLAARIGKDDSKVVDMMGYKLYKSLIRQSIFLLVSTLIDGDRREKSME